MVLFVKARDIYPTAATCVILVCRTVIAIVGFRWLMAGDTLNFGVAVVAFTLSVLPTQQIRESGLRTVATVTLALFLAAHIVFGMNLGLYATSTVYDKVMHVLGSAALAGILTLYFRRYCSVREIILPAELLAVLVLTGTLSAGMLWELFEFTIDQTGLFYAQRGLHDTMLDLMADAVGAIVTVSVFVRCIGMSTSRIRTN